MSGDYTTNMLADLNRLRGYSAALQGLMRGAAFSAPEAGTGDRSDRTVTVTVDAQGLPTQIRIVADWLDRLGADDLGAAITTRPPDRPATADDAVGEAAAASGWVDDVTEFQDGGRRGGCRPRPSSRCRCRTLRPGPGRCPTSPRTPSPRWSVRRRPRGLPSPSRFGRRSVGRARSDRPRIHPPRRAGRHVDADWAGGQRASC